MTKLLVLICPSPAGFEVPADSKGHPMAKRYFILCACQKKRLFDSKKEAADAWNKTNTTAST